MKRGMLFLLAGLMVVAISGLSAFAWDAALYPGDYVTANVAPTSTTGDCQSKMNCWVSILLPIPHTIWVTSGTTLYYFHTADLAYGQRSESRGNIRLNAALLHASLGNSGATGYSEFAFAW